MGWYRELELIDSNGSCGVVHSAEATGSRLLAMLLGRPLSIKIVHSELLGPLTIDAIRDRVLEVLSVYPAMYETSGTYESLVSTVKRARSPDEIVKLFLAK